ncbi:MAG TPA: hypothetical protein VHQ23_17855 [Ilumatobacteraceae bacterium]|nr:hypothetical protein [Ilumatobacteraceae bacterium]
MLRRWPIAAVVLAAIGIATVATAAPAAIVGGATANVPAVRLRPPGPHVGECPVFPANNAWNQEIASAALHPRSAEIISHIQAIGSDNIHPDVGSTFGIPYVVVPGDQPLVPITYDAYGDESDPGPFPIPLNAPVEDGSDGHVLVVQEQTCQLYELFVGRRAGAGWVAASGAKFDLLTGALRPIGWTSADAAGLPIFPGLVRYDEVAAGLIDHAIRVTFSQTQRGFVLPATHFASSNPDATLPAMGMRLRLSANYPIGNLTGQALVIATAMQRYGLIVADNGSNWFFQGAPDPRWNDEDLDQLKAIPGTAFEVVDTGPVRTG